MAKRAVLPGFEQYLEPESGPVRSFDDLTAREVGALFGVTVQAIDGWVRTGCPNTREGHHRVFDLAKVIQWRRQRDAEINAATGSTDPLLTGGNSPALETYRHWKAKQAEQDFLRRAGELLERAEVVNQFRATAARLRAQLETVERQHGRQVGDNIREAVKIAFEELDRAYTA